VAATGSTIHNTVAALHIVTARLPTGLAVQRVVTRSRIAKIRRGNKSVVRVAIWLATEMGPEVATEAELEQATGAEPGQAIAPAAVMGLGATDLAVGEIVWEAVTFHGAEEGTAMPSEAAPVAMTDPVLEAAAAAAPRVREAAGEAV
jgi:hypothetical protein